MDANEKILSAVSGAADQADLTVDEYRARQDPPREFEWHRAFVAELGEQGYAIVPVSPLVEIERITVVSIDGRYSFVYEDHDDFLRAVAGLHNDGLPAQVVTS